MKKLMTSAALLALLSGCGGSSGQPFVFTDTDTDTGTDTGGDNSDGGGGATTDPLNTGTTLPPDAREPTAATSVVRLEATSEADGDHGGYVSSVQYVAANDRFLVDGLGFDGPNVYSRGDPVGSLNGFAVYESDIRAFDSLTGDPIGQIVPYRALYGVSSNATPDGEPRTSFAIVRTGGYAGYGFGGFLYERNGSVTLPDSGQAVFSGDYAGLRVFNGRGGLEYTSGDLELAVDFRDFNANDAVRGNLSNRRAFDIDGVEITLGETDGLVLPTLRVEIVAGTDTIRANGELTGTMSSYNLDATGNIEEYETGSYYAVIAGNGTTVGDGGEIVGVIVITSTDPRYNIDVQETGGFILQRGVGN